METDTPAPAPGPEGAPSTPGGSVPADRRRSAVSTATIVVLTVVGIAAAWILLSMLAWAMAGGD